MKLFVDVKRRITIFKGVMGASGQGSKGILEKIGQYKLLLEKVCLLTFLCSIIIRALGFVLENRF